MNCRQSGHLEGAEGLASCDGDYGVVICQVRADFFQHRRHKLGLDGHKNDVALLYNLQDMESNLSCAWKPAVNDSFPSADSCHTKFNIASCLQPLTQSF